MVLFLVNTKEFFKGLLENFGKRLRKRFPKKDYSLW